MDQVWVASLSTSVSLRLKWYAENSSWSLGFPRATPLSETSFDKDTTNQGRAMGIRKIGKEKEDTSENKKTEAEDSTGREFQWVLKGLYGFKSPCLIFYTL